MNTKNQKVSKHNASKKGFKHQHNLSKGELNAKINAQIRQEIKVQNLIENSLKPDYLASL